MQNLPTPQDYDDLARDWYQFTLALIGTKGRVHYQDVPDVVQTIFTRAWKSQILDKYNPEYGPFSNFWVVYVFRSLWGIREQMWVEAPRWPVTPEGIVPDTRPYDDRTMHRILALEEFREFREYLSGIPRKPGGLPWPEVLDAVAEVFLSSSAYSRSRARSVDPMLLSQKLGTTYTAANALLNRLLHHATEWYARRELELHADAV